MTATTQTLRDQAFLPLECDVPVGMTLSQYRAQRGTGQGRGRRRRIGRRQAQFSTK